MAKTYYFKDEEEANRYFDNERKMKENSQKWHETDDPDERAMLHFQNQVMSGENDLIDGGNRVYDENTGTWSADYGNKAQNNNVQWVNEQNNKYVSPYNEQIDALYDEIVNQKGFSYNPENDASYKAYENMYRREGDRASKSTLADISTAQGGISSYAASAAQQASNAYAQALTDKIPELEALAYQKYSADRNDRYNQLNSLMALDNVQYGRYIDDRNFNYQLDRDKIADDRYNTEYARSIFERDRAYDRDVFESDRAFDQDVFESNRNYDRGVYEFDTSMDVKKSESAAERAVQSQQLSQQAYNDKFNQLMSLADAGVISYAQAMEMLDISVPQISSSSGGSSGGSGGSSKKTTKKTTTKNKTEQSEEDGVDTGVKESVENIVKAYEKGTMTQHEAEARLSSIEMEEWLKSR